MDPFWILTALVAWLTFGMAGLIFYRRAKKRMATVLKVWSGLK
ncbi:hypothetical protein [Mesorhizobium sp. M0938]